MPLNPIVATTLITTACLSLASAVTQAQDTAPQPQAVALWLDQAPEIDGVLDDAAWIKVAGHKPSVLSGWLSKRRADALPMQQRIAYVAYDAEHLYIAMQAFTTDIFELRSGSGDVAFLGDVLEVHIQAEGRPYQQFGVDIDNNLSRGDVPSDFREEDIRSQTDLRDNYWTIEIAVPWGVLGVEPGAGLDLGFNLTANLAHMGGTHWDTIMWQAPYNVREREVLMRLGAQPSAEAEQQSGQAKPQITVKQQAAKPLADPTTVIVAHTTQAPTIDADLGDTVWREARKHSNHRLDDWLVFGSQQKAQEDRQVFFAWDAKRLYVAIDVSSDDPEAIGVWAGAPNESDHLRLDFESAAVAVDCEGTHMDLILPYVIPADRAAVIDDKGWRAEMAIDWAHLGGIPDPGSTRAIVVTGFSHADGRLSWTLIQSPRQVDKGGTMRLATTAK